MAFYTESQLAKFPWIVCDRASLRDVDLADAFLGAIDIIASLADIPYNDGIVQGLERDTVENAQALACHASSPVAPRLTGCDGATIEALAEWLEEHAPTGFYFGSSEGDGALFGFWLLPEIADALESAGLDCEIPERIASLLERLSDFI